MTNKYLIIVTLMILPFALTQCNPDDEPINSGPVLLGEGRDYIIFPEGSWWKYENTKTGEIDSIVMENSFEEMKVFRCDENSISIEKENFYCEANSKTICRNVQYSVRPIWGCQPTNTRVRYFEFYAKDGCQSSSESAVFYYPFTLSLSGGGAQESVFQKLHDSLEISGTWYDEVAEFEVDRDFIYGSSETRRTRYYWAIGVGLVKRELLMLESDIVVDSWEIINYSINN